MQRLYGPRHLEVSVLNGLTYPNRVAYIDNSPEFEVILRGSPRPRSLPTSSGGSLLDAAHTSF